jgi:sulfur carrier protein
VIVNGKKKEFSSGITIYELIESMGLPKNIVTVRVNGEKIPKEDYDRKLYENSNVEVFSFIGGG